MLPILSYPMPAPQKAPRAPVLLTTADPTTEEEGKGCLRRLRPPALVRLPPLWVLWFPALAERASPHQTNKRVETLTSQS